MNTELSFFLKVTRNGLVLAALYFFSVYAASESLTYEICKPVLVFLGTYICTELAARYGLHKQQTKSADGKVLTLLF